MDSHCKRMKRLLSAFLLLTATVGHAADVPLPAHGASLRIAVVGDIGDGPNRIAPAIARVHAATPLDGIVITGDNFYPCGVGSANDPKWGTIAPLAKIGPPLFPVLGNHDYCGNANAQIGVPYWTFPAKEYALRNRIADFAMLDTTPYALGRSRAAEQTIVSLLDTSSATWRIVVGHHVIESSGWHGYARRTERERMQRLIPVMRREHVDLYICGHDHHLELLAGRPLLLISGAGSEPIAALALRPSTLYPDSIHRQLGFAVLEISDKALSIRFYDGRGSADGPAFTFAR
jgi:tartrate-resistant acid phosphatase type 5